MDGKTKTGVYKHTIVVEVLSEQNDISHLSLDQLAAEMDYGQFVGVQECTDISDELTLDELDVATRKMSSEVGFFNPDFEVIYE